MSQILAVVHDTIEDGGPDALTKFKMHVSDDPVLLFNLDLLTKVPNTTYESYIERIASSEHATRVKIEDLRQNSDITRLKGVGPKDHARIEKYNRAYCYLTKQYAKLLSV